MRFRRKSKKLKEENPKIQGNEIPRTSPVIADKVEEIVTPLSPIRNIVNSPSAISNHSFRSRRSRSTSSRFRKSIELTLEMVLSPSISATSSYHVLPSETPPPQSPSSTTTTPSPNVAPFKAQCVSNLPTKAPIYDNVLAELRSEKKFRSVSVDSRRWISDPHEDIMGQIRKGTPLKHVEPIPRIIHPITEAEGIGGVLARAIENRRNTMIYEQSSDEENEENNEINDDEWTDTE